MCLDLKIWKSLPNLLFFCALSVVISIAIYFIQIRVGLEPNIFLYIMIFIVALLGSIAVYELGETSKWAAAYSFQYLSLLVLTCLFIGNQFDYIDESVANETITTMVGILAALLPISLAIFSASLLIPSTYEKINSSKQYRDLKESNIKTSNELKNIRLQLAYFYRGTGNMRCKFCMDGKCLYIKDVKCGGFSRDIKYCPLWANLRQLTAEPETNELGKKQKNDVKE